MEKNDFAMKLAKIVYFCLVRPFKWLGSKIVARKYGKRLKAAKKRAMHEAELTGKAHYVVFANGKFYVYNRGGMLALAKAYRKKTGVSTDWRKLYVCEAHVVTEAEKAEHARQMEEKNKGMR